MPFDRDRHRRRSIRLKGYDYASAGAYFVTVCAQHRELLFTPEAVRAMIQRWWDKLPEKFPNVATDAFVIMPNHIHGIMVLAGANTVGADPRVGPPPMGEHTGSPRQRVGPKAGEEQLRGIAPTGQGEQEGQGEHMGSPLPTIVQWFKTMTTNEYIRGVKELGWAPFPGKLWQRNYYERVVRNDRELAAIRQYIQNNPLQWALDRDNPAQWTRRPPPETVDEYLEEAGV